MTMSETPLLWNKDAALARMMGMQSLLDKVTGLFLAQFPEAWASTQVHLEQKDWTEVKAKAHTLKGSAAELGLEALADALFSLERAAAEQDEPRALEAKAQIESISHKTLPLLKA